MVVIVNRAAGASNPTARELDETIAQLFAARGYEVRIVHPEPTADLTALAERAAKGDEQTIVAGGGDGTISAVASALAGTDKILGVLPLGTLNHFAKDLAIPLDLAAAIDTIIDGHTAQVDVGEVNGRAFINNSSLGIYPQIVANREAQQERLSRGKWSAFLWATLRAFRRFPFLHLHIIVEERQLERRTAFLFVGNNEYQMSGFNLGSRACLNAGKLGLYLTHRTGRLGLVRLALRALLGRLEQAEDFDAFCVTEATIQTRHARLLVATDGEVDWITPPLHYRIRPAALRVLVPRPKDAA
jgi:YegS/Rv2252/BmrU family lipid kinase